MMSPTDEATPRAPYPIDGLVIRLRQLIRRPLTTSTMVLVLALGIGVNAALLTVARSLSTQPPPAIPDNAALVRIRGTMADEASGRVFGRPLSRDELNDYAGAAFRGVAAWSTDEVDVEVGGGEPLLATASWVTGDLFGVLGVKPVVGGGLPASPPGAAPEPIAVIDHDLWLTRLGGSSDAVGRTLRVDGVVVTVVGVAPPRFRGAAVTSTDHVVWLPLAERSEVVGAPPGGAADSGSLQAVGLLRPGVSAAEASALVRRVAERDLRRPGSPGPRVGSASADVVPLRALNESPSLGTDTAVFTVYATITLLILLVTGATVSALFVGAGITRRRDIAVRLALGAGRPRVVGGLLAESVAVALAGAVVGILGLTVFLHVVSPHLPGVDLTIDFVALAGTLTFAAGTGILCGLFPALHATRLSLSDALRRTGSGVAPAHLGLQRRLVIGQIALSQPLLVAVGALLVLLVRDARLGSRSPVSERIAVVDFGAADGTPSSLPRAEARRTLQETADELRSLPGVSDVVAGSGGYVVADLTAEPRGSDGHGSPASVRIHGYYASPGYFALMHVPLVRGRGFEPDEREALVIGSDLAHRLWGDDDPVGRRMRRSWRGHAGDADMVIVGVYDADIAGRSAEGGLGGGTRVFVPTSMSDGVKGAFRMYPNGASALRLLVETEGPAQAVMAAVGSRIRSHGQTLPIRSIATLSELDRRRHAASVRLVLLAGAGGILALLLASVGLYAVVSLGVGERRREIGVRMAVGARAEQVVSHFFRTGLRLSAVGVFLGLPLSVLALRRLGGPLAVSGTVLGVGAAIVAAVVGVASLASWIPARRAATVDPAVTLRSE